MYFESLQTNFCNDYLTKSPRKAEVIKNARVAGNVAILPNSNNRALVIDSGNVVYLQSYDTLIISVDKTSGEIRKLWNGYSKTTLKHINDFLIPFGRSFNKKGWENFK